mmetsp:Transcript_82647/g.145828  ORF Transcript_82647/g.145828 Transcript_82647/m.145828 type:complete len:312 (-) Transcript_82647:689-1624(-)
MQTSPATPDSGSHVAGRLAAAAALVRFAGGMYACFAAVMDAFASSDPHIDAVESGFEWAAVELVEIHLSFGRVGCLSSASPASAIAAVHDFVLAWAYPVTCMASFVGTAASATAARAAAGVVASIAAVAAIVAAAPATAAAAAPAIAAAARPAAAARADVAAFVVTVAAAADPAAVVPAAALAGAGTAAAAVMALTCSAFHRDAAVLAAVEAFFVGVTHGGHLALASLAERVADDFEVSAPAEVIVSVAGVVENALEMRVTHLAARVVLVSDQPHHKAEGLASQAALPDLDSWHASQTPRLLRKLVRPESA